MTTLQALEDALRNAVVQVAGLSPAVIAWGDQDVQLSEAAPRVSLSLRDWTRVGQAEHFHGYDPSAPNGQQIWFSAAMLSFVTWQISVFAPRVVADGSPAFPTALEIARAIHVGLALPSVRDSLSTAGAGVQDEGSVRRLPAVVSGRYEDRAIVELRLLVQDIATERTTWIESAPVTGTVTQG